VSRARALSACVVALAWCGACASWTPADREIDALMREGRYREAAARLEQAQSRYGDRSQLLYALERALILHYAGDYAESNAAFERAKALADAAYTRSATQELVSWALNDRVRDYSGANFERAMIHVFAALNYTQLDRPEAALVEVRQLDHLLKTFETEYGDSYAYRRDAFGLFLSGMLYEDAAEWDDAYVAYWQALEAYEDYAGLYGVAAPRALRAAAARAAARVGSDAFREFELRWGRADAPVGALLGPPMPWMPLAQAGKVVVVHYNGRAPRKVEQFFDLSFGEGWAYVNATTAEGVDAEQLATAAAVAASIPATDTIRIALPRYVESGYAVERLEVRVAGWARVGPCELVQDVGAIAMQDLEDRMLSIRARAIARAALKYAVAKSVSEALRGDARGRHGRRGRYAGAADEAGRRALEELVAALLRAYAVLSERADTRSWSAVPDEIWLTELDLPVGVHGVELVFRARDGRIVQTQRASVRARRDQRSFLIVRTLR
jgi:hypothetical protein